MTKIRKFNGCIFLIFFFMVGCAHFPEFNPKKSPKTSSTHAPDFQWELPAHIAEPLVPEDNPMTQEKIALGKKLFFDPILSADSTVACSSCHILGRSFADKERFSKGVNDSLGTRNAPHLANVAWSKVFFWDGGVPTLELQVIAPITNPIEMHETMENVIKKLNRNAYYVAAFEQVFKRKPDTYSLIRAIACFERSIISVNSAYDKFVTHPTSETLSPMALEGMQIFTHAGCNACHPEPHFTNFVFENNGLYAEYSDAGRQRVTIRPQDEGKFKVPSLRNVVLTAPYMHDGSINTLDEVLLHYASGIKPHKNLSEKIDTTKLQILRHKEKREKLIEFLKTLTDTSFAYIR